MIISLYDINIIRKLKEHFNFKYYFKVFLSSLKNLFFLFYNLLKLIIKIFKYLFVIKIYNLNLKNLFLIIIFHH